MADINFRRIKDIILNIRANLVDGKIAIFNDNGSGVAYNSNNQIGELVPDRIYDKDTGAVYVNGRTFADVTVDSLTLSGGEFLTPYDVPVEDEIPKVNSTEDKLEGSGVYASNGNLTSVAGARFTLVSGTTRIENLSMPNDTDHPQLFMSNTGMVAAYGRNANASLRSYDSSNALASKVDAKVDGTVDCSLMNPITAYTLATDVYAGITNALYCAKFQTEYKFKGYLAVSSGTVIGTVSKICRTIARPSVDKYFARFHSTDASHYYPSSSPDGTVYKLSTDGYLTLVRDTEGGQSHRILFDDLTVSL